MSDQVNFDWFAEARPIESSRAAVGSFWVIGVAAVAGTVVLRRRGVPSFPLWSAVLNVAVTVLVFYGSTRFRAPAEPAVVLLARGRIRRRPAAVAPRRSHAGRVARAASLDASCPRPSVRPIGTQDVLPPESARWQALIATFAGLAERYGYGLVHGPMFEDIAVFARLGAGTDVVRKEMYDFRDKGDRHLALRPEATASVVRAFVQHRPTTPWKVWCAAPRRSATSGPRRAGCASTTSSTSR